MSKNMTRKGLAFGAGFALVATGLAAMPAQAAITGQVTLDPTEGTTYNSILESGITLESKFGPATDLDEDNNVTYLIENPSGASITVEMDGSYDGDTFNAADILVSSDEDRVGSGNAVSYSPASEPASAVTTADEFVYVRTLNPSSSSDATRALSITSSADKTVSLKVTAWYDNGNGVDGTASDGIIDTFEYVSPTVDVVLYPASSVPVTTKMSSATTRGADTVTATVELGNDVNPYMVRSGLGITFYKDGSNIDINGSTTSTDLNNIEYGGVDSIDPKTEVVTFTETAAEFVTDSKLNAGIYTARALYHASNPDVFVGARSAILDLRDGTNTDVKGVEVVFTESDNVAVDDVDNNATIREETLSVDVTGQILDASDDALRDAGVRVRATVTGEIIDSDTEITVVGSSDVIDAKDDEIVVFGFTDSDGQFPITINSNTGEDGDKVKVEFAALLSTGLYETSDTEEITWEEATVTDLVASPSEFLTGETVNVTFTVVDQFGEGLDSTSNGRLSISVEAYINGAVDADEYSETLQTTNGSASFSFANFATAGSDQQIEVEVLARNEGVESIGKKYFTVYNNLDTSAITIADEFETRVQYVDYVTGSLKDAAVNKAATDAGVIGLFDDSDLSEAGTDYARIVGTVLDANNAGQPGVPVTVAAEGVLFHDADTNTLAEDSITLVANAQGFFDVQALTQTAVPAGATVTITAGGVTETTLLKSYLADDIDSKNLVFDWTLPENIVKDTTYSIAVELMDVFGNPIRTKSSTGDPTVPALTMEADGSLQVNGVATINRNFNSTGVATIFIRSVNDVAGPGQLRAILSDFEYFTGKSTGTSTVDNVTDSHLDVKSTSWDESEWNSGTIAVDIDVLETAPAATTNQKVNAGSFKGYVAVYALGYEGQRLSAKIGNNWVIVDPIVNNQSATLARIVQFIGLPGIDIQVRIYIDRVLVDTIPLTTIM